MREDASTLDSVLSANSAAFYPRELYISEAIQALQDDDWQVRMAAAMAIVEIGPWATAAVSALVRVLERDKRDDVRMAVAEALGSIGPKAREAVPYLTRALDDQSAYVRWAATKALEAITGRKMETQ
jgi:HEAT repeat protein